MDRVRDNTSKVGLGIGRMSKGEVKAFQAAFVAADAGLDERVCKNGSGTDGETEGKKCKAGNTGTNGGLEKVYENEEFDKVKAEAGPNIATSISKMSKGEMQAFQAAFVAADKSLDERVCRNGSDNEAEGKKCKAGSTGTNGGLEKVYEGVVTV